MRSTPEFPNPHLFVQLSEKIEAVNGWARELFEDGQAVLAYDLGVDDEGQYCQLFVRPGTDLSDKSRYPDIFDDMRVIYTTVEQEADR